MPKTLIQASENWWNNWQAVMDTAIDSCVGMTAQIENHQINGEYEPEDLLDQLSGQLRQLRKQLEAVRVPF